MLVSQEGLCDALVGGHLLPDDVNELLGPDGPEGLLAPLVLDVPALLDNFHEPVDLRSRQRLVGISTVDQFLDLFEVRAALGKVNDKVMNPGHDGFVRGHNEFTVSERDYRFVFGAM